MEKDPAQSIGKPAKPKAPQASREDRLKAALKANMSRRKAQAKARDAGSEAGTKTGTEEE